MVKTRQLWLPALAALAPVGVTFWGASPPGGYLDVTLVALLLWAVVGVWWLVIAIRAFIRLPAPRARAVHHLWPLLALPVLLVSTTVAVRTGAVDRVTFEAHREGLERLVSEAGAGGPSPTDRQVGIFTVSTALVDRGTGCTLLKLQDAGFVLASSGFAHCPTPPKDDLRGGEGTTYEPLAGDWYTFTFVW